MTKRRQLDKILQMTLQRTSKYRKNSNGLENLQMTLQRTSTYRKNGLENKM